ncbi:unnamed protein product [Amoebophrya sp. A120]|nr:unnamed protein product [Amoebophrya sp. A120]|eukprot:GSA120T00019484001.1
MITSNQGFELEVAGETDYIHDMCFNYYGDRIAFCTSRQKISFWTKGRNPGGSRSATASPSGSNAGLHSKNNSNASLLQESAASSSSSSFANFKNVHQSSYNPADVVSAGAGAAAPGAPGSNAQAGSSTTLQQQQEQGPSSTGHAGTGTGTTATNKRKSTDIMLVEENNGSAGGIAAGATTFADSSFHGKKAKSADVLGTAGNSSSSAINASNLQQSEGQLHQPPVSASAPPSNHSSNANLLLGGQPSPEWHETSVLEGAHSGPIWRLDWAHPEYGTGILASCGEDRAVSIWSENPASTSWRKRAQLLDATKAVIDVKFAPRHFGLKVASASLDGYVRVYEAPDILNMGEWLLEDYSIAKGEGVQAVSWCPDIHQEYIAAVGTDGSLYIHGKDLVKRRWLLLHQEPHEKTNPDCLPKDVAFSPNLCRPYDLLVTCGTHFSANLWRFDPVSASTASSHVYGSGLLPPQQSSGGSQQQPGVAAAPGTFTKLSVMKVLCGPGMTPDLDEWNTIWRCSWNITGTMLTLAPESGQIQVWQTRQVNGGFGKDWVNTYNIEHNENSVSIQRKEKTVAVPMNHNSVGSLAAAGLQPN